jgi:peptidoglycan/LPS O-acetylase OafA/YrhL
LNSAPYGRVKATAHRVRGGMGGAPERDGDRRPLRLAVSPSSGSRLPGIEGARAVAAGSVLVYHCWLFGSPDGTSPRLGPLTGLMPHLALGVILFFSLSGFLLYRPFAAAVLRAAPGPGIGGYLRNRALRILPAYWVILLLTGVLLQVALLREDASGLQLGSLAREPDTLVKNVLLVQSYDPNTLLTGIGPAWSLVIEVAFYLALPVLATLAMTLARPATSRSGRRRAALAPAAAMLLLGLAGKAVAHLVAGSSSGWEADWPSVLARSFLANADLFAYGMALAVLHTEVRDGAVTLPRWWRAGALAAAGATALAAVWIVPEGMGLGVAKYDVLMAVSCSLLLAIVVLPDPGPPRRRRLLWLLDTRPLVVVGLVSYSLFLWHEPLVYWLREHGLTRPGAGGLVVNLVVLAAGAGALAALTYRYVERPATARKQSAAAPRNSGSALAAGADQPSRHRREHRGQLPRQSGVQPAIERPEHAPGHGQPQ